jgi:hypothetical protein
MRWLLPLLLTAALARGGLVFPETLKQVEAPADARSITTDFEFTNSGDKPVKIRHYDAACSCMSVQAKDSKLQYGPGEKGVIRTVFDLGNFAGTVDKVAAIWLEGDRDDAPSIRLTVRVKIPELVKLETKTLRWALGGAATPQSLKILIQHDKPIKITKVSGTNENFRHELVTVRDGLEYEIKVTPANLATPGIGILRIDTDCEIARHKVQQAFLVVSAAVKPAG